MSDLADFLLARIAEDEAAAREAIDQERPGTHWHWVMDHNDTPVAPGHLQAAQDDGESVSLRTVEEYPTRNGWSLPHFVVQSGEVHGGGGEHIARHDPARVLAECEAKHAVAEHHAKAGATRHPGYDCRWCGMHWPCFDLRAAALPYADHPDYDESWRP